jgi:hypothetical protein
MVADDAAYGAEKRWRDARPATIFEGSRADGGDL